MPIKCQSCEILYYPPRDDTYFTLKQNFNLYNFEKCSFILSHNGSLFTCGSAPQGGPGNKAIPLTSTSWAHKSTSTDKIMHEYYLLYTRTSCGRCSQHSHVVSHRTWIPATQFKYSSRMVQINLTKHTPTLPITLRVATTPSVQNQLKFWVIFNTFSINFYTK